MLVLLLNMHAGKREMHAGKREVKPLPHGSKRRAFFLAAVPLIHRMLSPPTKNVTPSCGRLMRALRETKSAKKCASCRDTRVGIAEQGSAQRPSRWLRNGASRPREVMGVTNDIPVLTPELSRFRRRGTKPWRAPTPDCTSLCGIRPKSVK